MSCYDYDLLVSNDHVLEYEDCGVFEAIKQGYVDDEYDLAEMERTLDVVLGLRPALDPWSADSVIQVVSRQVM